MLDLHRTRVDRDGLAVLILMRRYAYRRGIRVTLRHAPGSLANALARAHLGPLYGTAAHGSTADPSVVESRLAGTKEGRGDVVDDAVAEALASEGSGEGVVAFAEDRAYFPVEEALEQRRDVEPAFIS